MRTKEISFNEIDNLIENYIDKGGEVYNLDNGSLGYGTIIFLNNGLSLKQFVVEERYLNEWSSTHVLKIYNNELPQKYIKMIEENEEKLKKEEEDYKTCLSVYKQALSLER